VLLLKPKYTSARLDDIFYSTVLEKIETGAVNAEEFQHITQGFRNKKSKDMY
jgi:hypothetical protein